jgi:transposase
MWTVENRARYERRGLRYPTDLTDTEWALVAPHIRPAKRGGRPRTVNVREVMSAVLYLLGTGCQWRALPKDFPPRTTVFEYLDLKLIRFGGAFLALAGGLLMHRTRPPYSLEFRRQMVDLVQAGRDPAELAREFDLSAESIRAWVALAARKEGGREEKGEGLSAAEREELGRLRRENKQLRVERDILSRAAAWFARETGAVPSGSSNS